MLTNDAELVARFQTKVVPTGGCAFWVGAVSDDGYGRFTLPGNRCVRQHVFAWELVNGPVRARSCFTHATNRCASASTTCRSAPNGRTWPT